MKHLNSFAAGFCLAGCLVFALMGAEYALLFSFLMFAYNAWRVVA